MTAKVNLKTLRMLAGARVRRPRRLRHWILLGVIVMAALAPVLVMLGSYWHFRAIAYRETRRHQAGVLSGCVLRGNVEELTKVLQKWPDSVDAPDWKERTPLITAAMTENGVRCAVVLLEAGANIRARDARGRTALHQYPGSTETVKLLRMKGLALDVFAAAGHGMVDELTAMLEDDPGRARAVDPGGCNALDHAAEAGQKAAAEILVRYGGEARLTAAVRLGMVERTREILAVDPDAVNEKVSGPLANPIYAALLAKDQAMVELLLEAGAKVERHSPCLRRALQQRWAVVYEMLLQRTVTHDDIAGRVTDVDGTPLADVDVDAWAWYAGHETRTNALGYFALRKVPSDGLVQLEYSTPGYGPHLVVDQAKGQADVRVTLRRDALIHGMVRDPDGQPATGALVRAGRGPIYGDRVVLKNVWTQTESDAQGHYTLYLEPDEYHVEVTRGENEMVRVDQLPIATGERHAMDFQLEKRLTLVARVVESELRRPVADVVLYDCSEPDRCGISDPNGVVRITGLPAARAVFRVMNPQWGRWWSADSCSPSARREELGEGRWQQNFSFLDFEITEGMAPAEIVVEPAVTVRGMVVDPCERPVAEATVAAALTGTGNSLTGDTRFSVTTDKDGTFVMFLPAGKNRQYNLVAHDGEYGQWRRWANGVTAPLWTGPGDRIEGVVIRLNQPARVAGTVVDRTGLPVVGRPVRAVPCDWRGNRYYNPVTVTDERGRFELGFLRPGETIVEAAPFWLFPRQGPALSRCRVQAGAQKEGELLWLVAETEKESAEGD